MAARHFSFKTGKLGAGEKHAEYIAGIGKYSRDDVRHLSDHNLPDWAVDGRAFFAAADAHERANGRSYSEIEFSIPRECADPIDYALRYAGELLGNRHAYRLGVHDKLAADGGRNIHAHLMFSERRLDGIARDRELFFRRANAKHPERGGAAKDRTWNERQHIDQLRRGYEAHAKAHGIAVDLRSNEAQGLGPAEIKIGPKKRQNDRWRANKSASVSALRQHRHRVQTLRDEIRTTKSELRAARRERARQESNICRDAERRNHMPCRSPLGAMRAEIRQGRTLYRWGRGTAAGLAALVDRGNEITLAGKPSLQKARALAELAKAKGWTNLVLSGSDAFKRLAIKEAIAQGLHIANPELADIVKEEETQMLHQKSRTELARQWLMTAAPVDALEATRLLNDSERLLRLFDGSPEAQRWARIQRQRAEGVPEPLLGYEIDRESPPKAVCGRVRYVAKHVWIEPDDRRGHVVPVTPAERLQPGQHVAVQVSGETTVFPDYTPRPRRSV